MTNGKTMAASTVALPLLKVTAEKISKDIIDEFHDLVLEDKTKCNCDGDQYGHLDHFHSLIVWFQIVSEPDQKC